MSITVQEITKVYGAQKALDSVSFSISGGDVVGLLGPNGAGKSTLMKILTGYIPPTSGKASICNLDVQTNSLEVRRSIGYLPENNPLYPDMFIKEFLMFIADIHKIDHKKSRIEEIIELTGLNPEIHKRIGQLSKGYRQRVGLAQALIHNPNVLILDEPTSGLDPNQIIEIRNLITNIGKKKTVLLSTHIMQEVEATCSRVIIINKGKIVADESIENLRNFSSDAHIKVEFDKVIEKNLLLSINGVTSCTAIGEKTWILEQKKGADIRKELFKFAVENELNVLLLEKEKSTVEDIFRQLTQQKSTQQK